MGLLQQLLGGFVSFDGGAEVPERGGTPGSRALNRLASSIASLGRETLTWEQVSVRDLLHDLLHELIADRVLLDRPYFHRPLRCVGYGGRHRLCPTSRITIARVQEATLARVHPDRSARLAEMIDHRQALDTGVLCAGLEGGKTREIFF